MRYVYGIVVVICTSTVILAQASVERIQDVKKIYVHSFGTGENADQIGNKVSTELVRSNQFDVVQTPEKADAILTVAGSTVRTYIFSGDNNASGRTRIDATAGVKLVNKDEKILWADNVSNGPFSQNATSSLAERIVKNLLKAISDAKKKSGSSTKQR